MKTPILDENWNWRRYGALLNVPPGHCGNDPDGQIRLVTCNIDGRHCAQKQNKDKMQHLRVLVLVKRSFLCTRKSVETEQQIKKADLVSTLKT